MNIFDFSTLNSVDLEHLVCDLWNAESLRGENHFKTFSEGKDAGIDLLFATNECHYHTIGQVKHYLRSGFSKLKSDLLKYEASKIAKLKPRYYKLATSLDLTLRQAEELVDILSPYVESIHDIYGQTDLNQLLRNHPEIIERHFKLWFSGTAALKKIMRSHVDGRSEFEEQKIKRKVRLFVETEALRNAETILKKSTVLIITGEPGVGKTTLAEFISYKFIRNGYEFCVIQDDIKEVEKILRDDESRQLFYFDDFLGHNALEIVRAKSSESALLHIIGRIRHSTNKKLILTTRSFILNAAIDESERLKRFSLKADESVVKLTSYTEAVKLQLLRNHVEESELSDAHKRILGMRLVEDFVVRHPNFYPRSVEFITNLKNVGYINPKQLEWFIVTNFNKPDEIWRHAYEHQIIQTDRMLLNTLLSFGDLTPLYNLEIAFLARLAYEKRDYSLNPEMQQFKHALQRLEGGFLTVDYLLDEISNKWEDYLDFINPSLVDFLIKYIQEDRTEAIRIAESTVFTQQLMKRFFPLTLDGSYEQGPIPSDLFNRLYNNPGIYIRREVDKLIVALLLIRYDKCDDRFPQASKLLTSITNWMNMADEFISIDYLDHLLINEQDDRFIKLIKSIGAKTFAPVLYWTSSLEHVEQYRYLLPVKYQLSLHEVFENYPAENWDDYFTRLFNASVETVYYLRETNEIDDDEMEDKLRELVRLKAIYNNLGIQVTLDITNSKGYWL